MPDFDIGPQPVRIGGRPPEYPKESPAIAGWQRGTARISDQAQQLLEGTVRQEQANDEMGALVSYKAKLAALDENVASIKDPDTRLSTYRTGLTGIHDELVKEYPRLSDSTRKAIDSESIEDEKEHFFKTLADRHASSHAAFEANLKDIAHLAARTTNNNSLIKYENTGLAAITKAVNNGILNPEQGKLATHDFLYNIQKERMFDLASSNPDKAAKFTLETSHLTIEDYKSFAKLIADESTAKNNVAEAAFKNDRAKVTQMVREHPELASHPEFEKYLKPEDLRTLFHYLDKDELHHYELEMENNAKTMSPEEFSKWWSDVDYSLHVDKAGSDFLTRSFNREIANTRNSFAKYKANTIEAINKHITKVLPPFALRGVIRDPNQDFKDQIKAELKDATAFKDDKNYSDVRKTAKGILDEINDYYNAHLPPGSKPIGKEPEPIVTPTATPSPEPTVAPSAGIPATPTPEPTTTTLEEPVPIGTPKPAPMGAASVGPDLEKYEKATRAIPRGPVKGEQHLLPEKYGELGDVRPLGPGEYIKMPNGMITSEETITVPYGDKWLVLPSLWIVDGVPTHVSEDDALIFAGHSGLEWPHFDSQQDADKYAHVREMRWELDSDTTKQPPLWTKPKK